MLVRNAFSSAASMIPSTSGRPQSRKPCTSTLSTKVWVSAGGARPGSTSSSAVNAANSSGRNEPFSRSRMLAVMLFLRPPGRNSGPGSMTITTPV